MNPDLVNQDLVNSYNEYMISRGYNGTGDFALNIDIITGNLPG